MNPAEDFAGARLSPLGQLMERLGWEWSIYSDAMRRLVVVVHRGGLHIHLTEEFANPVGLDASTGCLDAVADALRRGVATGATGRHDLLMTRAGYDPPCTYTARLEPSP